jgi:predicted nucleic acid-binding protein
MNVDAAPAAFVDTNVFVYAADAGDPVRAPVAQRLIGELIATGALRVSTQVLQELYVTITRKFRKPLTAAQALRYLDQIAVAPVTTTDYAAIRAAIELSSSARLSFWDSLVVVAAVRSGAKRLYTEDLQHGSKILGIEVVNPFHPVPRK